MPDTRYQNLTFIGGGKMAEAILSRLISGKTIHPEKITVTDVDRDRLDYIQEKYAVKISTSNPEAVIGADAVILAVKPQQMENVLGEISGNFGQRLVISIAAGIKISFIQSRLDEAKVVRVMPNTAALVGQAITALSAGTLVTKAEIEVVKRIFRAVGKVTEIGEEMQNVVTAISGSGPAYFFYLTELLAKAGVELGLDHDLSNELAVQTAIGSGALLESGSAPAQLRKMVTSPGGTTEAAIKSLDENGVFDIVKKAVRSANLKASELSKE